MKDEKVMNFNEEVNENTEATVEGQEVVEVNKPGFFGKFNGLKTWQKFLIGGTVAVVCFVGGKKVYKALTQKPEAVAEVVDMVIENSPEVVESAVEEAKAV